MNADTPRADSARAAATRLRPTPVGIAAFLLATLGLVLGATVDMGWWVLFAVGVFGPPVLREVGVLRDRDEFQREAARLAGFHAYLFGGLFLVIATTVRTWGTRTLGGDEISASVAAAVLLVAYLLSYLTSYWGARGATFRILLTFGTLWLAFVVLSHGLLNPGLLIVAPFFVMAFAARRWPRAAGAVLVGLATWAFFLFGVGEAFAGRASAQHVGLVFVLPLAFCGVALLREARSTRE